MTTLRLSHARGNIQRDLARQGEREASREPVDGERSRRQRGTQPPSNRSVARHRAKTHVRTRKEALAIDTSKPTAHDDGLSYRHV